MPKTLRFKPERRAIGNNGILRASLETIFVTNYACRSFGFLRFLDACTSHLVPHIGTVGRPNVLGVSCAAGPACRSRSGAAVAANDVRRTEWRAATAVTPSRSR
jgi:hypothetical protein